MYTGHEVMGMVTRVDRESGHVRVKDDGEAFCTVCCGGETEILAEGDPLHLEGLQPGDYIRSECVPGEDGKLLARKIVLLRPAWRMIESPEM
ncbi:MAG TPA: hypothetical protein VLH58_07780 [Candidatus Methylomirabilis sp.]|nr:hypothetical protein [Candidatus Methylomirabilis sp.]HSC71236.1 hypothetical protein [Candidatus Methylomirabilis sp.]